MRERNEEGILDWKRKWAILELNLVYNNAYNTIRDWTNWSVRFHQNGASQSNSQLEKLKIQKMCRSSWCFYIQDTNQFFFTYRRNQTLRKNPNFLYYLVK